MTVLNINYEFLFFLIFQYNYFEFEVLHFNKISKYKVGQCCFSKMHILMCRSLNMNVDLNIKYFIFIFFILLFFNLYYLCCYYVLNYYINKKNIFIYFNVKSFYLFYQIYIYFF